MVETGGVNRARIYVGWLCVAVAFALVVLLGLGVVDPFADAGLAGIDSLGALAAALAPVLAGPVVLFGLGLWLLRGPRR